MMKNYCVLILIVFVQTLFGQKLNSNFNNLKRKVTHSPEEVIKESKSLKKKAIHMNSTEFISKSDYLTSYAFCLLGHPDSCIYYARSSIEYSKKNNYIKGEALGLRVLGSQYAKMGLLDKSKELLNSGLKLVEKLNDDEAFEIKGEIYSSLLLTIPSEKIEERQAIALKALHYYLKIKNETQKKGPLPAAYINLSNIYYTNKKYDSAYLYSQKALHNINLGDIYRLVIIYCDTGHILLAQGEYSKAICIYKKALTYCTGENFSDKKLEILKGLSETYVKIGDNKTALYYLQQYDVLYSDKMQKNQIAVNSIYNTVDETDSSRTIKILIITLISCFILGVKIIYIYRKRKPIKFNEKINNQEEPKSTEFNISPEMEDKILYNLNKFEKKEGFIDQAVSLSSMSNDFQCNTKYLSLVIKRHKNKSFVQYINDLRIEYLLDKLKTDSNYSKFKIYYLSELCGFSTQRAFTLAFINKTNMKPLEYIKKYHNNDI